MAFTKSALLFICTVFLASQVQSSYIKYNDTDLATIVQKIVENGEKALEKILNVAANLIAGGNNDFVGTQSKVLDDIEKVLEKGIDAFNKVVTDLSKDSDAESQKLVQCLTSAETDSVKVVQNLVKSLTNCAQKDLVTFLNKIDPLVKDVTTLEPKAKAALAKLNKCKGNGMSAVLCIVTAVTNAVDAIKNDFPTIQKDIASIKEDLPTFKDAVVSCWTKTSKPGFLSDAAKVIDKISACAKA